MADSWKQVWEDIVNALRGTEPELEPDKPPGETPPHEVRELTSPLVVNLDTLPETTTSEELLAAEPAASFQPPSVASEASLTSDTAEMVDDQPAEERMDEESAVPELEAAHSLPDGPGQSLAGPLSSPAELAVTETVAPPTSKRTRRTSWVQRVVYGGVVVLAAIILWFMGGSRLWAQWLAPRPPAADVIATFDGGQITIADLEAHLALLVPAEFQEVARSPQTLIFLVQDMVMDELARRWSAQRQPDTDETFSHTMQHITESLNLQSLDLQMHENTIPVAESEIQDYYNTNRAEFGDQPLDAVREQIRQILVSQREGNYLEEYVQRLVDNASISRNFELLDVPPPREDELRRYYESNMEQFELPRQVSVDELQFLIGLDEAAARQAADDALLQIRSGATFLAVSQTITQSRLLTDTLIPEGTHEPAWDAVVFALTEGEVSHVFQTEDSFYIVRLNELEPARTQTLEEVRPTVLAAVEQQKAEEWFESNANKTLMTINGRQYTLGQFYQEYQELPQVAQVEFAGSEGMKALAELLTERLLLVEDTYSLLLDVENQPLTDEARLQVLKQMMHQEQIDDRIEITDEEIQAFYDENIDLMARLPQVRIRYIRIGLGASEDEAQRARERADEAYRRLVPGLFGQGEAFAVVAQEYSEDPETAANGGELPGWIGESEDILTELETHPFHEMVLTLQQDEISQPFEFDGSVYIVQLIERTEPETTSLEEARPFIEEILNEQEHAELEIEMQETLLEQANFEIYTSVLDEYFQQLPTPEGFSFPLEPSS